MNDFASLLLALLESDADGFDYEALTAELARQREMMESIQLSIGDDAEDLSQKPSARWTGDEIRFAQCDSRAGMLGELLDGLRQEEILYEDLPQELKAGVEDRLLAMVIRCLENEDEVPDICFRLNEYGKMRCRMPGTLGPMKIPPWAQALQAVEMRLLEMAELHLPDPIAEIVKVQYATVCMMKMFFVCELFPAEEGVNYRFNELKFLVDEGWRVWAITEESAANDE